MANKSVDAYKAILSKYQINNLIDDSVLGYEIGMKEERKEREQFIADVELFYNYSQETLQAESQYFEVNNTNLTEDEFLFGNGTKREVYTRQLTALQFAQHYIECDERIKKGYSISNRTLSEHAELDAKIFASSLKLPDGRLVDGLTYEYAKQKQMEFKERGKKAIIYNDLYYQIINKKINEIKDELNSKIQLRHKNSKINIFKFNIGLFLLYLLFFSPICLGIALMRFVPAISKAFGIILAVLVLFSPYIIRIIYRIIKKNKENKAYKFAQQECNRISNELTAAVDVIMERTDEIYVNDFHSIAQREQLECGKKIAEIKAINERINDMRRIAGSPLPSELNLRLLPDIIKFMSGGLATNYEDALWKATQTNDQKNAQEKARIHSEKLAMLQMQETARYQQKQLEIARRQAEAQAQAAEYAKQQAEAAERQAKAAEETAKSAERQQADTEELLRRTDDPYYLNKWKNGG